MKFYVLVIAAVAYLAYVHGGKSVVNTKQMKYRLWYMYVYMRNIYSHYKESDDQNKKLESATF